MSEHLIDAVIALLLLNGAVLLLFLVNGALRGDRRSRPKNDAGHPKRRHTDRTPGAGQVS